jgi:hypothetical protein
MSTDWGPDSLDYSPVDEDVVKAANPAKANPVAPTGTTAPAATQAAPVGNFRRERLMATYGADPIMAQRSAKSQGMVDYFNNLGIPTAAQHDDYIARSLADPNSSLNAGLGRMRAQQEAYYKSMEAPQKAAPSAAATPSQAISPISPPLMDPNNFWPKDGVAYPQYGSKGPAPVAAPSRAAMLNAKAPVVQGQGAAPNSLYGPATAGAYNAAARATPLVANFLGKFSNAYQTAANAMRSAGGVAAHGLPSLAKNAGNFGPLARGVNATGAALFGPEAQMVMAGLNGVNVMTNQPYFGQYYNNLADTLEGNNHQGIYESLIAPGISAAAGFGRGVMDHTGATQLGIMMANGGMPNFQQQARLEREFGVNFDPFGASKWGEGLAGMFYGNHTPGVYGDPKQNFTSPEKMSLPMTSQPFDMNAWNVQQGNAAAQKAMTQNSDQRLQESAREYFKRDWTPPNHSPTPQVPAFKYSNGYAPGPVDPNFQEPTAGAEGAGWGEEERGVAPMSMADLLAQPQQAAAPQPIREQAPAKQPAPQKQKTWQDYIVEQANATTAAQMKRNSSERAAERRRELSKR